MQQVFSVGDIRPSQVEEPEARAALVWILGQFGEHIQSERARDAWPTLCLSSTVSCRRPTNFLSFAPPLSHHLYLPPSRPPAPSAAPYLLQPLADSFSTEPPAVRLALLTAAAKLFFRRPPEAQKLLGACVVAGLGDSDQDVHDRALLYYRWVCFFLIFFGGGPELDGWAGAFLAIPHR